MKYIIFSNKLFHFSYKILNALGEKITFLWNFCHFFLVLFYEWNTSINDSFQFFGFFFWESFPGRGFIFQCKCLFSIEGSFIFRGVGVQKKSWDGVRVPPMPPHWGKPWRAGDLVILFRVPHRAINTLRGKGGEDWFPLWEGSHCFKVQG